jgi:perosamine synthetase
MSKKIELDAPCVGLKEKEYLAKAVDSGFVSSFGPFIAEFESAIAQFLGCKGAVAVQSGTSAIYMALHELGIGIGDEVIVPALTFAATVNPVLMLGATPVIVDVEEKTWNINPLKADAAITDKTKAIIPVHLYGNPCAMDVLMNVARDNHLHVIEDATESLGATFNRTHTGCFGDFGCLSFNGNKMITTGGGGMIVGHDTGKIEHIRYLVNQAKDKEQPGYHSEMGFNYRMTNVEAALGLAQFHELETFIKKKKRFRKIYQDILEDIAFVRFQANQSGGEGCCWLNCIQIYKKVNIQQIENDLKKKGIPSRRIFTPLGKFPYLKEFAENCPNAEALYSSGICLPSSTLNEEESVEKAALIVKEVLK